MQRYDVIIIGAGPAGLSAAINLKLRNKNILLFGNGGLSSKVTRSERVKNYLGLPNVSGEELNNSFSAHIASMGISVIPEIVKGIYPMGSYFSIISGEAIYEARCVILANGVSSARPIPGEQELLGRGVSHCATCDGFLYKGKTVVCICNNKNEEADVKYLAEIADKVIFISQYDSQLTGRNMEILNGTVRRIEKTTQGLLVKTSDRDIEADGVFVLHDDMSPEQLLPGLERENGFIKVDQGMQTNVKGCFACGDCVGSPFQYMKAAGEGNTAAHAAISYLAKQI